jgi:hypothetical protein
VTIRLCHAPLCDRCAVIEAVTLLLSLAVGVLIVRWWALVLAVPVGLIASSTFSFEGFSDAEVGVLFGVAVVIGLATGVLVGKGLRSLAHQS